MPRQIFSDDLEARLIELWADYQKSKNGQMVKRIVREREIAEKLNAAFRSGWLNPEKNLKLHFEQARAMQSFYASPSFATSLVRSFYNFWNQSRRFIVRKNMSLLSRRRKTQRTKSSQANRQQIKLPYAFQRRKAIVRENTKIQGEDCKLR